MMCWIMLLMERVCCIETQVEWRILITLRLIVIACDGALRPSKSCPCFAMLVLMRRREIGRTRSHQQCEASETYKRVRSVDGT